VLQPEEVRDAVQARASDLAGCIERAGAARRYVAGAVKMRFNVDSAGRSERVVIAESRLGNLEMERCIAERARRVVFERPSGGRATQVEYTLELQPTGEAAVVDWPPERVEDRIRGLARGLASCGELEDVRVTLYVERTGSVGSVGFTGHDVDAPGGAAALDCAARQIRAWKLPRDELGRVVRTDFVVPSRDSAAPPDSPPVRRKR
jgi:hypothetical protein